MRRRIHAPVREQHRWLCQVLRGHYGYYGVIFNFRALRAFQTCVVKLWRKTLGKRSQKGHVTWASYNRLLTVFRSRTGYPSGLPQMIARLRSFLKSPVR
jgi:hypothetical protein